MQCSNCANICCKSCVMDNLNNHLYEHCKVCLTRSDYIYSILAQKFLESLMIVEKKFEFECCLCQLKTGSDTEFVSHISSQHPCDVIKTFSKTNSNNNNHDNHYNHYINDNNVNNKSGNLKNVSINQESNNISQISQLKNHYNDNQNKIQLGQFIKSENSRTLGNFGIYYCGRPQNFAFNCGCCDGICGPTDGCPCKECMEYNCEIRSLPNDSLLNKQGLASKWNGCIFFCGRSFLYNQSQGLFNQKKLTCDGRSTCQECSLLKFMLNKGNYLIKTKNVFNIFNSNEQNVSYFMLHTRSGSSSTDRNKQSNGLFQQCTITNTPPQQNVFFNKPNNECYKQARGMLFSRSGQNRDINNFTEADKSKTLDTDQSLQCPKENSNATRFGMLYTRSAQISKSSSDNKPINFDHFSSTKQISDTKNHSNSISKDCDIFIGHKTNGSVLPLIVYDSHADITISKLDLIEILKIENKIRLSDEAKKLFDQNCYEAVLPFHILDEFLIKAALKQFGFDPEKDDSFKAYHIATHRFIEDKEVKNSVVWMKYDKCKIENYKVGDFINFEMIKLFDTLAKEYYLKNIIQNFTPNIILAGSLS
jgi:hypothetical protein